MSAPEANDPTPGPSLPSDAELRVLRGLWRGGEQTVRELHERLTPEWDVGYTTILKLLQRMREKGLVSRTSEGRAHVYRAAIREAATERRLVRDLASRAFGGSMSRLLQRALPAEAADSEELEEIRRLLERLDEGAAGGSEPDPGGRSR